jgi:hypothetical protein
MMTTQPSIHYSEGYQAARIGRRWDSCGYPTGTRAYYEWQLGWRTFDEEYQQSLNQKTRPE